MKRVLVLFVLLALICGPVMGMLVYGQEAVDGEGFPYPSGEPDGLLPDELAVTQASISSLSTVDFRLWTPESYSPVAGFPLAYWNNVDKSTAIELWNAQPTLLYSDFPALWTALEVWFHSYNPDDDYIGFAVGFQPGDTSNASADYLIVDWKRGTQWFNFGSPSCTPGSWAYRGLAVSHVLGVPTADEFWGHVNFDAACSDLNNGVAELARGSTLGSTGWWYGGWIHVRLEYTPTRFKVYVNGQPEIDLPGNFGQGRWALYDFSQASTYFIGGQVESLEVPAAIDVKPGSYPNAININGHGVIPVAILGHPEFDVTWVDVATLEFAGLEVRVKGNDDPQCSIEDVSGDEGVPDGWDDLVCQFVDDPVQWVPGNGFATLTGYLLPEYGGAWFEAGDEITIVP